MKNEIFEKIKDLYYEFEREHNGTTKVSQQRDIKDLGGIKKLVTEYRKASVAEAK